MFVAERTVVCPRMAVAVAATRNQRMGLNWHVSKSDKTTRDRHRAHAVTGGRTSVYASLTRSRMVRESRCLDARVRVACVRVWHRGLVHGRASHFRRRVLMPDFLRVFFFLLQKSGHSSFRRLQLQSAPHPQVRCVRTPSAFYPRGTST